MTRFCTNCGKEIADGIAFCTECGAAAPSDATVTQPAPQKAAAMPKAVTPPPIIHSQSNDIQPPKGKYGVVGTGTYFGLMLLFAIPVIGWIVCLIMAFASRNENKKHFAKAMLLWIIIGIVLSVIAYFVFRWLGNSLSAYINKITGGQFDDLQELLTQFKQFENGGISLPFN